MWHIEPLGWFELIALLLNNHLIETTAAQRLGYLLDILKTNISEILGSRRIIVPAVKL
jgi:hypothetical protein